MSRSRYWCFTLNNYTAEDEARLLLDDARVSYIVYGREVGESGTPHLQGFVQFQARVRLAQVKQFVGPTAHCEYCRNVPASITYCKKDGDRSERGECIGGVGKRTDLDEFKESVKSGMLSLSAIRETHSNVYAKYPRFCLEYIQDYSPKKEIEAHALLQWQQDLNATLNLAADDRSVVFVVDTAGNNGKTWFAHYYASLHDDVQVIQPGRKADMAYVLDSSIRVLFVDAPRSKQGDFIQYDFLEDCKNGYVFSTKYESRVKQLKRIHVVVLMNEMPDQTKLSADRYVIVNI